MYMTPRQKVKASMEAKRLIEAGHSPAAKAYVLFYPDIHPDAEDEIRGLSDPIPPDQLSGSELPAHRRLDSYL